VVVLAAQKMGAGVAAHRALLNYTGQAWDVPTLTNLVAKETKLNAAELKKLATDSQITDMLETTHQIGDALGVNGTPALFSLKARIPGAPSANDLKTFLQEAAKP
jgi:protein-disulfide isomerase